MRRFAQIDVLGLFFCGVAALSSTVQAAAGECVEWTLRRTYGPAQREIHAMAYDSARGVTVWLSCAPAASKASSLAECAGLSAFARHRWPSYTRPICTRTVETCTIRARELGDVAGHRLLGKCRLKCGS